MAKTYPLRIEQWGEEGERLISRGHHNWSAFLAACHQSIADHPDYFPPDTAEQAKFELIVGADGVQHEWLRAGPPHKPCGCEWDDLRFYSTVSGPGPGVSRRPVSASGDGGEVTTMPDDCIPTGPLEQEPAGGYLPIEDRLRLLYRALAGVELGTWDRRIVDWMAKNHDPPTLLTIVSLIERARVVAVADYALDGLLGREGGCPYCTCCSREGCHPGLDSECPYSTALERITCPCTED